MTKTELLRACQTCGYIPGEASWRERNGTIYLMTRHDMLPVLLIVGQTEGFSGQSVDLNGIAALACPISRENVKALQRAFPYTAPASTSEHAITVGVGDRLGLVTGAHILFAAARYFPSWPSNRSVSWRSPDVRIVLCWTMWRGRCLSPAMKGAMLRMATI